MQCTPLAYTISSQVCMLRWLFIKCEICDANFKQKTRFPARFYVTLWDLYTCLSAMN